MVFPGSRWLLALCLLSWCCNGLNSRNSYFAPLVVWSDTIQDSQSLDFLKTIAEKFPGLYILSMEIGKDMVEKMKKNVLDPDSDICQILAQDPNLEEGYIALTFSLGVQFLKTVAQKCQTPPMKEMIEIPAKKFLGDLLQLVLKKS